jgi:tetratricopeptide (TPR) repeat protein
MVKSFESFPLSDRISNTFISYITYIGQAIWPDGLAVLYSYPLLFTTWQVFGAVFLLMAITTAVLWKAKRIPYATVGWLWYMSTLVPVIGIVQVGLQARADRYTYVPLIGLFIMAAWGIPELSKKWRYRKEALFASSTVVLFCLCIVTWTQVRFWQDNITLLDHAVKVTDNNYLAYYSRGLAWWRLGNTGQAIGDYDKALSIHPKYDIAYNNRGSVYAVLGNYRQAIRDFDKALEISPNNAGLYINRGNAHSLLGNDRQAIGDYDKVIEINPKDVDAYSRRGAAYANLGNYQQAIRDYGQALSINPKYAEAYYNRGNSNVRLGNYREAIGDYDKAIAINVKYAATYNNRAFAYLRLGNTGQAVEDLKTAARLGYKDAQNTLKGRGMGW